MKHDVMKKLALIILDGWGIGDATRSDAIASAHVPFYRSLLTTYPHSTLKTYGEHVGLPEGQMGNSEVGHMNIGAGRIVYQDLAKINKEVRENKIDKNPVLLEAFAYAKKNNKAVHLMFTRTSCTCTSCTICAGLAVSAKFSSMLLLTGATPTPKAALVF
jgi:bisphosphoglycerate-independent phosphoglycerate mutase (AlkP superfamily)